MRSGGVERRRSAVVVIGELKLSFNLELILQAVDRAGPPTRSGSPPIFCPRKGRESDARIAICAAGSASHAAVTNTGDVEVIVKPPTTAPRRNPKKRSRLVAEHRRKGDPVWAAVRARRS